MNDRRVPPANRILCCLSGNSRAQILLAGISLDQRIRIMISAHRWTARDALMTMLVGVGVLAPMKAVWFAHGPWPGCLRAAHTPMPLTQYITRINGTISLAGRTGADAYIYLRFQANNSFARHRLHAPGRCVGPQRCAGNVRVQCRARTPEQQQQQHWKVGCLPAMCGVMVVGTHKARGSTARRAGVRRQARSSPAPAPTAARQRRSGATLVRLITRRHSNTHDQNRDDIHSGNAM